MYNKYEALCPLMLNKGQKCSQFRGICATFEPKKPFFPNQHLTHGAMQGEAFKFESSKGILGRLHLPRDTVLGIFCHVLPTHGAFVVPTAWYQDQIIHTEDFNIN